MRAFLPFVVVGLATGSVYALAAMGLVVTYTTSGVFNFAHGAVAMAGAYAFYSLRVQAGLPTVAALAIAVLVVGPVIGVIVDRVLFRRLAGSPTSTYVVVSLGFLVALQGLAIVIYGPATRSVAPIFSTATFRLPGVNVGYDQLALVVIAAVAACALVVFFGKTHAGLRTRAVVDDRDLTGLMGADAARITTLSWMLGCSFAALSGVLLSPILGVDAALLTLLVIQAFGAAAVGRLVSLPLTYLGAIAIGIGAALSTKYVAQHPLLSGIPTSLPFIVLFVVLVVSPKGRFAEIADVAQQAGTGLRARSRRLPVPALVGFVAVAAALPLFLTSSRLLTATSTLAYVLIFASLALLIGLSRQVSLCHAVFVVFGATTLAHLQSAGWPWLVALLAAGLIMVPVAALLAIPAIRLSGLFLALATFGFGLLAQNLLFGTDFVFGKKASVTLHRPELFGISLNNDHVFYYFVLAVVVLGVVAVEAARVTRLGRLLRGLADSPTAVESLGINPTASRVLVFCLSGFLAAIAGGLLGSLTRSVSPASFDFTQSLVWVTVLVAAGASTFGGSVLAAVLFVAVPSFITSSNVLEYQPVFFGLAAIALAQTPNGVASIFRFPDFGGLARASSWRSGSRRRAERVREPATPFSGRNDVLA
jgi:branched-subunit amino acid ABC-type transport system permease component